MTSSPLGPASPLNLHPVILMHVQEQGDVLLGVGGVTLSDTQVIKLLPSGEIQSKKGEIENVRVKCLISLLSASCH